MKTEKTKTQLITEQIEELKKTCIENEVYPVVIVGLTFEIKNNSIDLSKGTATHIKLPNLNNNTLLAVLQNAYLSAKNLILSSKKLKKLN